MVEYYQDYQRTGEAGDGGIWGDGGIQVEGLQTVSREYTHSIWNQHLCVKLKLHLNFKAGLFFLNVFFKSFID